MGKVRTTEKTLRKLQNKGQRHPPLSSATCGSADSRVTKSRKEVAEGGVPADAQFKLSSLVSVIRKVAILPHRIHLSLGETSSGARAPAPAWEVAQPPHNTPPPTPPGGRGQQTGRGDREARADATLLAARSPPSRASSPAAPVSGRAAGRAGCSRGAWDFARPRPTPRGSGPRAPPEAAGATAPGQSRRSSRQARSAHPAGTGPGAPPSAAAHPGPAAPAAADKPRDQPGAAAFRKARPAGPRALQSDCHTPSEQFSLKASRDSLYILTNDGAAEDPTPPPAVSASPGLLPRGHRTHLSLGMLENRAGPPKNIALSSSQYNAACAFLTCRGPEL